MRKAYFLLPLLLGVLSAGSVAGATEAESVGEHSMVMVASPVFRRMYAAPTDLDKVWDAYQHANAMLLTRARTGLRARVRVTDATGAVVDGYDEHFSSVPVKLREVRSNRETIFVDGTHCTRTDSAAFSCVDAEMDINVLFGLRELTADAIVSVAESGSTYVIDQAAVLEVEGTSLVSTAPTLNHTVVTLVVNQHGRPVSVKEVEWVSGEITVQAEYVYMFDEAVQPFDVPRH